MLDKEISKEIMSWLIEMDMQSVSLRSVSIQERVRRNYYKHLVKFESGSPMLLSGLCMGFLERDSRERQGSMTYRIRIRGRNESSGLVERLKHIECIDPYEGEPKEEMVEERANFDIMKMTMPGPDGGTEIVGAFTKRGDYIGDVAVAERLVDRMGISPEMVSRESSVCNIGFCEGEDRWYGWSHRAIAGFGIGDKIYDEEFGRDDVPPQQHGFGDIENMRHARVAAIRYAECVS